MTNLFEKIKKEKYISRILILVFALTLSAVLYNLFELPTKLVTGGSTGISIITEYLFGIEPSLMISIISYSTLILSFIFLGIEKTSSAIIASFLYPILISLTSNVTNYIKVDTTDMLTISIFMGVLYGIYSGLIYRAGFSSGGVSTFSHILYKYKKISVTASNTTINMVLVVLGGALFGWQKVMYALIILFISRFVADKVLLGTSKNKNIFIFTDKNKEITDFILNELHSGVTEFNAVGGFNNKKRKVLMTAVTNHSYFKLKQGSKQIDKNSFMIVTDSYHVSDDK